MVNTEKQQERLTVSRMEMVTNAMFSRSQLAAKLFDPRRSIDDECGFPETENLSYREYRGMYDREAVAARVVEVLPAESWQVQPTVFETEDVDQETAFEAAWQTLNATLQKTTWYKSPESSPIWEYLHRIDKLSGVAHYGILLIGVDDGKPLSEAAEGIGEQGEATGKNTVNRKLLYLRSFDESQARIIKTESDASNPRYGQPTEYHISLSNPSSYSLIASTSYEKVHWTRVIHVADNLASSEVLGVPRMRPVWNNLLGLRKLYGGSPEMYWHGAFPGLSFETHPQSDAAIDETSVRAQVEPYMNSLQRYFAVSGLTVKSLSPQVVDPTPQIEVQLTAICIKLGIPKRIFMGSERGELSSSQDDSTWNDRLSFRQNYYITPRIIVPFVDRLIGLGVLPKPREFSVVWPDLASLGAETKATIALHRTEAMAKYVQGSVEALIAPMDYLTRVLDISKDEAEEILSNVIPIEEPEETEEPEEE